MRDALAYRGEFLLDIVSSAFVPVCLQLILWFSIFKTSGQTHFAGMTYSELLTYTWTSLLFTQIRGGDQDFALAEMIRTGSLSNYLLRPVSVIEFTYIRGLGEKLLVIGLCLSLGLLATSFTPLSPTHLLLGLMLALVGNLIHYLFGVLLSAVAFYWENAFALLMVKNMVVSLLSGELLPLNLFPTHYEWIWKSTPFYLYVFGPTQMALGKWSYEMWLQQMGIALLWTLALLILVRITWRFSIYRYQGLGG